MPIGEYLKNARIKKGLTQSELAQAVGVSQGAIGNYETNVASPKESVLIKLMQVLEVDANYLYQDFVQTSDSRMALTSQEMKLLLSYRAATEAAREIAMETLVNHPRQEEAVSAS